VPLEYKGLLNTRGYASGRQFLNLANNTASCPNQLVCSNTVVVSTAIFPVLCVLQIWMMRIRSCGRSCPLCCKRVGTRSLSTKPSSLGCLSWGSSRRGLNLVGTPHLVFAIPCGLDNRHCTILIMSYAQTCMPTWTYLNSLMHSFTTSLVFDSLNSVFCKQQASAFNYYATLPHQGHILVYSVQL